MKKLTQKRLKQVLEYAPETGLFFWKYDRSRKALAGLVAGYIKKSDGYVYITVDGVKYFAHYLAWLYMYGHFPKRRLGRLNTINHDNRITNITDGPGPVKSLASNNTSGVKGVKWRKNNKRWAAQITVNGERIHLGEYVEFTRAVCARLEAEVKYGLPLDSSAFQYFKKYGGVGIGSGREKHLT